MKNGNRWTNNKGFTLAELMLAVAIIIILGALAMVGVTRYLNGLHLLEMDNAAKEIFYAAQNRITAELNSGTLGRLESTAFDTDTSNASSKHAPANTKMVIFNTGVSDLSKTLWDEMLPFGSIDDTVRLGGSYIIIYSLDLDANLATVHDVWYASDEGTGFGRGWSESESTLKDADYSVLNNARINRSRDSRLKFNGNSKAIVGHYGREAVTINTLFNFTDLSFNIVNDEVLYGDFTFKANQRGTSLTTSSILETLEPQLKVTITGENATNIKVYDIKSLTDSGVVIKLPDPDTNTLSYRLILDNITAKGQRFRDLISTDTTGNFILGEDITVNIEVYSNKELANIDSVTAVDNSLFQYVKTTTDAGTTTTEAGIGKIRHLQNLSSEVSGVDLSKSGLAVDKALQTADLLWDNETHTSGFVNFKLGSTTEIGGDIVYNTASDTTSKTSGSFYPINFTTDTSDESLQLLEYDAGYKETESSTATKHHSITNLKIKGANAGLFGTVGTDNTVSIAHPNHLLTVRNLTMDKTTISDATSAAGVVVANGIKAVKLESVAINGATVTATSGNSGGAVGYAKNGLTLESVSVSESRISASIYAGGLVGEFNGSAGGSGTHIGVENCSVEWSSDTANIIGATAGGLVGSITTAYPQFANSYSTAIVSGTDAAGGLIGTVKDSYKSGSDISYIRSCYVGGHVVTDGTSGRPVYSTSDFNVTGTNVAGGFIGKIEAGSGSGLVVKASYSTASARADQAGGFVGQVTGAAADIVNTSISDCYAVGLVKDTTANVTETNPDSTPSGLFAGSIMATTPESSTVTVYLSGNRYFELIDENMPAVGGGNVEVGVANSKIYAAETNMTTYTSFFRLRDKGTLSAYNGKLTEMFDDRYFLPTVHDLDGSATLTTHVGDWQPVDTLVFNTAS